MAKPGATESERKQPTLPVHGAAALPSVEVDSYSLELDGEEGYVGDRVNKGAFVEMLDRIRKSLRDAGEEDPLGNTRSDRISRKKLSNLLAKGEPEAAAVVQSAVEEFAQQFQQVVRRFLRLKSWRDTECIVVGGGFSGSRVGELAVGRAGILLKADGLNVDLRLLHHDPDEAGLIGTAHLLPAWMVEGHDAILAADVGGTNIRAGVVELNLPKGKDLSRAAVANMELWRHDAEKELKRDEAVDYLIKMLSGLMATARKRGLKLAPVVGIGCPGVIREDGSIERGAQNLPGNWESSKFNLPGVIRERLPRIGEHETLVVMHNDAVVQGLSELPYANGHEHWGILTIGTGLGNARFTTRAKRKRSD
jgi:predicted NBD/HSP70 family sugar kinase